MSPGRTSSNNRLSLMGMFFERGIGSRTLCAYNSNLSVGWVAYSVRSMHIVLLTCIHGEQHR